MGRNCKEEKPYSNPAANILFSAFNIGYQNILEM